MKKTRQGKTSPKPDASVQPPPVSASGEGTKTANSEVVKPLTQEERQQFAKLEGVIEAKLGDFFDVGNAIMEIKNKELYRETHSNFNVYCQDRWGFGRSYANKLIGSAERLQLLPENLPKPANEWQMRPFLKLDPDQFPKKWEAVVQAAGPGKKVTSRIVEESLNLPGKKRKRKNAKLSEAKVTIADLFERIRAAVKEENVEDALRELGKLEKLLKG